MVWFQCEDCGENLKKPKLPNHFRICSASKLSCIDCGETFGQQSVQGHNQCITEAEKYGPKGQGKVSYGTHTKANNESKQKPDVDINVGLSSRPPWFCSLCNTNATSKQALLLHADGKKHRAKARAFHAAKQQSEQTDNSTPTMKASTKDHQQRELSGNKNTEEPKPQEAEDSNQLELPREVVPNNNLVPENENSSSKRKRKLNTSESESSRKKNDDNYSGDVSNGEVIQAKRAQVEEPNCAVKKSSSIDTNNKDNINESACMDQNISNKIKWKKLISTILKSNSALGKSGSISGSSGEIIEALEENPCTSPMEICFWDAETSLQSAPDNELDSSQVSDIIYESMDHFSPVPFSFEAKMDADDTSFVDCSRQPDAFNLPFVSSKEKIICVKDEINECQTETVCSSGDINLIAVEGRTGKSISNTSLLDYVGINSSHATNLKCENGEFFPPISGRPSDANGTTANGLSSLSVHCTQSSMPSSKHLICEEDEREDKVIPTCNLRCPTNVTNEAVRSNNCSPSGLRSLDDDADVCILEDISDPVHPPLSVIPARPLVVSQRSTFSDPLHQTGVGGMRLKMNDERLTFRVALQDLSQPKSEASPPDGALAVPLLRHQRIALSWMVQKETASLHCSGGILADDQGLGKTISTIALILKERSPSSMAMKQRGLEALNLDEDDSGVLELGEMKQDGNSVNVMVTSSMKSNILAKGRPAAGTLVVCPTSVLRQWAEELRNKVTSKANISVLVYHGSNRTKDPHELAKYDVVLTTYSIVSMEVPKQPLVDKDDDEKGKPESHGLPHAELSSSKKRKYPPSPSKKSKDRKGLDNAFLESVARPLARVGWFRVVLDEAQSIKNHRTQVARACWGLRAKRRWCLSGTPIQNAVDDLYSYFRFLRYDPYAVYKSFCSMIKVPINRNPTNGYKKLQAVLKTIMLRRTKGTFLDGEPIINLPPKSIEMKKVDFSEEERDFYAKLEADSRAQFKVYAAAGTVKQNYVNILLMLLRLRQACDHPLLVKGYDSNSCWRSSLEVAKKLPREKQMGLLNCLEACLAICGICNDPPEDAVVTICGHVFCNQCICEHLTGDDNLCPAAHCKIQLSVTSVFSRTTLKSSLYGQPGQDFNSELSETPKPCLEDPISDSSKIKAALEFLKSLPGSRDHALSSSSLNSHGQLSRCPENSSDFHSGVSSKDVTEKISVVDEGVNGSNKKLVEKAIVFSQWTRMLDLLEARLKMSSIQYRRLDGTMSVAARDKAVKDFNTVPEVTVMIMSLKAASLGLNMVAACHVLLLDLWWNPTTEDQAIDRAHRIGQTRPVTVLRFTVKDTVEDRILALQQKKREMVASAFGEDETGSRQTRLTVDDLKYLFMA